MKSLDDLDQFGPPMFLTFPLLRQIVATGTSAL